MFVNIQRLVQNFEVQSHLFKQLWSQYVLHIQQVLYFILLMHSINHSKVSFETVFTCQEKPVSIHVIIPTSLPLAIQSL